MTTTDNTVPQQDATPQQQFTQNPKPLGRLYKWVRAFFVINIISNVVLGLGAVLMLTLGSVMFGPNEPLSIGDWLEGIGGLFYLLSILVCIVLFCVFSYRATKNVHLFGEDIDMKPGWAVGWYFIPFANLFKPYQAMTEMWTGSFASGTFSTNTSDFSDGNPKWAPPKTLPIWWGCWIVGNIVSNISMRMGLDAGIMGAYASDVPQYKFTLYLDIVSCVALMIAALLILPVLKNIAQSQDIRINADVFD